MIDRGNTAAAGTRLAFRKSSCGVNTGPRRRKLDTRRPAKTFELLLNCSRRPLRRPRSDRHLMGARLLMRVAAVALLRVAAAAPLPTAWPPPHNTSTQCVHMLAKHKLDWLLEPFTCTKAQKTSNAHIVLGTGLGGTGTRSVASAVDKLGYPACHSYRPCGNQTFRVSTRGPDGPMA